MGIKSGPCEFVRDSVYGKTRSDGEYYYCIIHRTRTSSATPCLWGQREEIKEGKPNG